MLCFQFIPKLDKIVVTFDGGITTMNFAEAAMLIQGSVCVFGKKVWIRLFAYTEYQVFSLMYGIYDQK